MAILLTVGIFALTLWRRRRATKRLRALTMIDADRMTGLEFERYVASLLRSRGFRQVRLTETYDLGVDIVAQKDGVMWGIQVKRYSHMVKAAAVRQVVTALKMYKCQRAMVITNSVFSRPAQRLAESNNCVLIHKDILAEWILGFSDNKPEGLFL